MRDPWRPSRRMAFMAPVAAAACSTLPKGPPADEMFRNAATLSESVHSGVSSVDGEQRLTVRLCRYPDLGLGWLWVHARTPQGFFSYVDHLAACTREATPQGGDVATYADAANTLVFERRGSLASPRSASIRGAVRAHRSATSRFGAGDHPLSFEIAFTAARLYSGLLRGRTEVFGRSRGSVTIDGRRFDMEGPAQFHEQRQSTPRFTQPFAYITLWGENAASTLLVTAARREGYLLEGERSIEAEHVRLDPPGPQRTFNIRMKDGRTLDGAAEVVQAYTIPIVGQSWRGHMVRVDLGGQRLVGHMNDFLPDRVPYGS